MRRSGKTRAGWRRFGGGSIGLALVLLAFPPWGQAVSIPVENSGFEEPRQGRPGDCTDGSPPTSAFCDPGGITSWELDDPHDVASSQLDYGVWFATNGDFQGGAFQGNQVGYVSSSVPGNEVAIQQTLGEVLEPDVRYTLEVKVGNVNPVAPEFEGFPGYRTELWAGERLLVFDRNAERSESGPPGEGQWRTSTNVYTASRAEPNLGDPLRIRLVNLLRDADDDGDADGIDANFDLVSLDVVAEEPLLYRFGFADPDGELEGFFSYTPGNGNAQGIPETANVFVTRATGKLSVFEDLVFTGSAIAVAAGSVLIGFSGADATGFELSFLRSPSLEESLPLSDFDPEGSRVLLEGDTQVRGEPPGTFVEEVPEPGLLATWIAAAGALGLLHARRSGRKQADFEVGLRAASRRRAKPVQPSS